MVKFARRKFLVAGVSAASGGAIARSVQAQPAPAAPAPAQNAGEPLDAIVGSDEDEFTGPVNRPNRPAGPPTPPPLPYDRAMSRLLIRCSRLGMEQFERGRRDTRFNGSIRELESYVQELNPYTQVSNFRVLLDATTTLFPSLGRIGRGVAQRVVTPTLVFIGFVLASDRNTIILFRGTSNPKEWMANFQAGQSNYVQSGITRGRVHTGFLRLYNQLSGEVRRIANQLNPERPCFIAGHSLGGALATLAAADLAHNYPNLRNQIRLYSYGAPRVGNQAFVEFLGAIAPNSYRIFNVSDMVPMVPPSEALEQQYNHWGEEWMFLDYAQGSVGLSHSTSVYQVAIDRQIETNAMPNFPTSC